MNSINLILVDIDNTLINIHDSHKQALNYAIQEIYGISYQDVEREIVIMQRCRPQDLTAEHPILHLSIASNKSKSISNMDMLSRAYGLYENELMHSIAIMPGAEEFLIACQMKQLPIVAITNNYMSLALNRLVHTKIAQYINKIVTPELYGVAKPSQFLFQSILKDYHTKPEYTIMIGDNLVTDGGCQAIGINFYLIESDKSEQQYKDIIRRHI